MAQREMTAAVESLEYAGLYLVLTPFPDGQRWGYWVGTDQFEWTAYPTRYGIAVDRDQALDKAQAEAGDLVKDIAAGRTHPEKRSRRRRPLAAQVALQAYANRLTDEGWPANLVDALFASSLFYGRAAIDSNYQSCADDGINVHMGPSGTLLGIARKRGPAEVAQVKADNVARREQATGSYWQNEHWESLDASSCQQLLEANGQVILPDRPELEGLNALTKLLEQSDTSGPERGF